MTEARFIRSNKERWEAFDHYLHHNRQLSPDELSDLYIQITDDLAYARTNYPASNLVPYLNQLAVKAHRRIYRSKKESGSRIFRIFRQEIPAAAWRHRKQFRYAAIIFSVSIFLGFLSAWLNPQYPNQILGDAYIQMTQQNIDKGDPMGVYRKTDASMMFIGIFANNIRVSFYAFIAGILGSIPAGLILLFNGVMVGAFLSFFINKGLLVVALSTIFLHGAVELTAIVIAGGCGLLIGNSILFPGTYSRMLSLRMAGKDALLIMLGLSPFVLLAAFIEGYLTRHYLELGLAGRLLVILPSFFLVTWYFFIYPKKAISHGTTEV